MPDNHQTNELLIRLDERAASIQKEIKAINDDINELKLQMKADRLEIRETLKNYVTKDEFSPIQRAIYAVASLIIMTVLGTLLSLVVTKGGP